MKNYKFWLLSSGIFFLSIHPLASKAQFGNLLKKADSSLKSLQKSTVTSNQSSGSGNATPNAGSSNVIPSGLDIQGGLKQALQKGLQTGVGLVSAPDGFFKNTAIKLLFPPEAQKMEKTLRSIGLNKTCDEAILSMNRAAEDASKKALPIFLQAIGQMNIQDGMSILNGKEDAATQYFQVNTHDALKKAFRPSVDSSLKKVNASAYWNSAMTAYNKVPFVSKINPDLGDYVTNQCITGLFYMIAKEELKIRKDLSARTSPLLQKVFGFADSQKGSGVQ
jgi:hypothetical protein